MTKICCRDKIETATPTLVADNSKDSVMITKTCFECERERTFEMAEHMYESPMVEMELFDSPFDDEGNFVWLCNDSFGHYEELSDEDKTSYNSWSYYENCVEVLSDSSWADFRYFYCDGCDRMVCRQSPSNGWHSQVHYEMDSGYESCLKCYEEEIVANGVSRDSIEAGELPGMFFSGDNHELVEAGYENISGTLYINSGLSISDAQQTVLNLMDDDKQVVIAYESMGIGGGEGYISIHAKAM